MPLFTTEEADVCIVVRCESVTKDGTHAYHVFGITDADNNYYDWKDTTLAADPSDAQVKAAIHAHLTANVVKQAPAPVYSATSGTDILGTTLV